MDRGAWQSPSSLAPFPHHNTRTLLHTQTTTTTTTTQAHEVYLRTAIGNAPWPIGLTMVGIHERTGREKISSSKVAHIMNNEMQRKYLTSVKRLMRFAQVRASIRSHSVSHTHGFCSSARVPSL